MASKNGDQDFARRLRALMESRELSGYALSNMAGLNSNRIYDYMHGRNNPTLYALRRIRRALCCDWDELLGKEEI